MKRQAKAVFAWAAVLGMALGLLLTFHGSALAARNAGGTYSSPIGAFVNGTIADADQVNALIDDFASEMTDSLSRSGKGGMLARLRGVDGTSNLPAYAFTSETTLGLYRAGASDLRISDDGTDIAKFTPTGLTLYQAATAEKGVVVTQSTSNGAGTTSTGNGTGAGVVGTGGATGNGGTFTGGATGGAGASGTGTGATGSGIVGQGAGSGSGGIFVGGGTGPGVTATGGTGNNYGVVGTGTGTGVGGRFAAGTAATGADPTNALELTNGNLKLSGTAPNKDEALTNTLTPANVVKAWATITTDGAGGITLDDGFNIASVSIAGGNIIATIADDFANTSYVAMPQINNSALLRVVSTTKNVGSTTFDIAAFDNITTKTWGDHDVSAESVVIEVVWIGRQ